MRSSLDTVVLSRSYAAVRNASARFARVPFRTETPTQKSSLSRARIETELVRPFRPVTHLLTHTNNHFTRV